MCGRWRILSSRKFGEPMKIHHIGYLTGNIAKAQAHFEALGFEAEGAREHDVFRDIDVQFLTNGAYRVELVEPCPESSQAYHLLKRYKNTPYRICYETSDLAGQTARLEGSGYMLIQKPLICPCIQEGYARFLLYPKVEFKKIMEPAAQ